MWGERVECTVFSCKSEDIAKKVRKYIKKNKSESEIMELVNSDSQLNLSVKGGKFQKGDNEIVDSIPWVVGLSENIYKDDLVYFVDIRKTLSPTPKELNEAKGLITADYQNYLEQQWIKELRAKYDVEVFEPVVESFAKE